MTLADKAILNASTGRTSLTQRERNRISIAVLHESKIPAKKIGSVLGVDITTVHRWITRQEKELTFIDRPRPGAPLRYDADSRKRLIAFYCQTTMLPDGHGRWTLRTAAIHLKNHPQELGISPTKSTLQRILNAENLKPHRTKYFLQITDPDFFPKMEHLLALRRNPPEHLFFFDECPGIHVRQRLSPSILSTMSEEKAVLWLEEFEYIRNGTLDVVAFLDNKSGEIYAQCRSDHTQTTLNEVFTEHVQYTEALAGDQKLHYVMDNLASHSSYSFCRLVAKLSQIDTPKHLKKSLAAERREWLGKTDKRIVIHFTPFHGSWLNSVENWFGILGATCLGESYATPNELVCAIENYIVKWNADYAHPFAFNYTGEGLHPKAVLRFMKMIETAPGKFHNRFLTKQLQLMVNLFNGYRDQIPDETWREFTVQLEQEADTVTAQIQKDDKPKRKLHTLEHLAHLRELLQVFLIEDGVE